jgi:Glycosyl transferases group 1
MNDKAGFRPSVRAGATLIKSKLRRLREVDHFPDRVCPTNSGWRLPLVILLVTMDESLAQMQFHMFAKYSNEFSSLGFTFISRTYQKVVALGDIPHADAVFVQSSYTPPEGELEGVLARLRSANPQAVFTYFDWFAPTDIRMAERVEPFVSFYVKKALLRDRNAYRVELNGHTNLCDYYAFNYGTENPPATWKIPLAVVDRLVAGPSFSIARELISYFEVPTLVMNNDRAVDVQARIETQGTQWYQLMRSQAAAAVAGLSGMNVATGRIPHRTYMAELANSKLCFSPFGYGEICWRDFEAIAVGAVLIKPNMDHIECSPNIYQNGKTYIAVNWDFSDLNEKIAELISDPDRRRQIAVDAFSALHNYIRDDGPLRLLNRLTKRTLENV